MNRRRLLIGGAAALLVVAALLLALLDLRAFLRFYLWAYLFWLGIALGSLGIVMMHHLTGGGWGFVIRRTCEAAMMTLPLLAVLFLPVLLGVGLLYPWMDPARVAADHGMQHRAILYNAPWFWARSLFYFAVWIGFAWIMRRWSLAQDDPDADPTAYTARFQTWCGPGLVAYLLTLTVASIDWVLSLEPRFASTIFGLVLLVGQGVGAFAFAALVAVRLAKRRRPAPDEDPPARLAGNVGPRNWYDVANLLFSFVLLWAYMAFSQYLISWNGNRVADAAWYVHRQTGAWGVLAVSLIALHFGLPFLLLVFGGLKRRTGGLTAVAALLLLARLLDLLWMVLPSFYPDGFPVSALYVVMPLALGVPWLAFFAWNLARAPELPLRDPRMVVTPEKEAA